MNSDDPIIDLDAIESAVKEDPTLLAGLVKTVGKQMALTGPVYKELETARIGWKGALQNVFERNQELSKRTQDIKHLKEEVKRLEDENKSLQIGLYQLAKIFTELEVPDGKFKTLMKQLKVEDIDRLKKDNES